ncbi:MAG: class I SAM-dependent methyltransferase [Ignavibacteriales bacterium]|nr:class I SAM-dependent methyltransferase [Ignavibacteriales bacterium]
MNNSNCNNDCNSESKCDIFDFMAKYVGLTVIHPGGLNATKELIDCLQINSGTRVIDIACGKGTTSLFIAEKYNCEVIGIDISKDLIEEANFLKKKKGLEQKVKFQVGDAIQLPFSDNEFDIAISQAMLVLVADKIKTIKEAYRVVKKGGKAGWLELSWKKEINKEFLEKVTNVLCAYCMTNVNTYNEWVEIFKKAGINDLIVKKGENVGGNFFDMIKDEGFFNAFKIMYNSIKNKKIRNRINIMENFFEEYFEYFGYGIYVLQK